MKKIATKIITISSQIGIASLFLVLLFSNAKADDEVIVLENNNFNKMADSVFSLFKKEELMTAATDDSIVVDLDDVSNDLNKKEEEENPKNEDNTSEETKKEEIKEVPKVEEPPAVENKTPLEYEVLETYVGNLTGYGPDCYGCSGKTRSGHDLNKSVYYDDPEFGTVRILAADSSFGKNAIFRVSNVPGMDSFIGIVLDTGGNVGFNRGTLFDLAFATEKDPNIIGLTSNVTFELLRRGIAW